MKQFVQRGEPEVRRNSIRNIWGIALGLCSVLPLNLLETAARTDSPHSAQYLAGQNGERTCEIRSLFLRSHISLSSSYSSALIAPQYVNDRSFCLPCSPHILSFSFSFIWMLVAVYSFRTVYSRLESASERFERGEITESATPHTWRRFIGNISPHPTPRFTPDDKKPAARKWGENINSLWWCANEVLDVKSGEREHEGIRYTIITKRFHSFHGTMRMRMT